MEPETKIVKIEKLTEEAFAPFGDIIGPKERAPDWKMELGPPTWFAGFSIDGTTRIGFSSNPYRKPPTEYVLSQFEQHQTVTQSVVLMDGKPGILTVAPPTPWGTKPEVEKIRAFLLDGAGGIVMSRLTWHGHDFPLVFPMYPPTLNWVIIHEVETYEDIINGKLELTHEVDIKESFNTVVQLTW